MFFSILPISHIAGYLPAHTFGDSQLNVFSTARQIPFP